MNQIKDGSYNCEPPPELTTSTKLRTKTLIIARAGMLECGRNFKGSIPETCKTCGVLDDKNHRMNVCTNWHHPNELKDLKRIEFQDVYSNDEQTLQTVIKHIQGLWELSIGKGIMKRRLSKN